MLSVTDRNYGITALHNYGFTVRLSPKELEDQSFTPIEIEIVKKVNTSPYSVAKLTRVQVGPSFPQQGNKIITHFQSKVSK
jgi:hypothetical protein